MATMAWKAISGPAGPNGHVEYFFFVIEGEIPHFGGHGGGSSVTRWSRQSTQLTQLSPVDADS